MAEQTLLEKELDDLYNAVAAGETRGQRVGLYRRIAAYVLKTVAAGGSLVVATGLFASLNQILGIAVLLAVLADAVSSNYKLLVAEVEAGYAFGALRRRVKGEFNRAASPWIQKQNQGDVEASKELQKLMEQAHTTLLQEIERIRTLLEQADIDALKTLSLDQERASLPKK